MTYQLLLFAPARFTATAVYYLAALSVLAIATPYIANTIGFVAAVGVSYIGHLRLTLKLNW